jgi:hypothetical protein
MKKTVLLLVRFLSPTNAGSSQQNTGVVARGEFILGKKGGPKSGLSVFLSWIM